MTAWLCISDIPGGYDEQQLLELCVAYGPVRRAEVGRDREGRHLKFGFVEMVRQGDAQRVRDALDGTQLEGRTLTVAFVKEPWHREM